MRTIQIIFGLSYLILSAINAQAQLQLAAGARMQQSAQSHLNATNGLKINAGGKLEVNGFVTVEDALTNQGGVGALEIKSTSSSQGSLIQPDQNTEATVQQYLSAIDYHYLASPVNNQAIVPEFIPLNEGNPFGTHDFYRYDEVNNTWINIKNSDGTLNNEFEINFTPMRGYALAYAESAYVRNFRGTLNAGVLNTNLTKTQDKGNGWNLIGNPYPSTLAANTLAQETNNLLSQNAAVLDDVYHALYLWNEQSGYEGSRNDYIVYNHLSDAAWLGVGQAFMVKAKNHNQSFAFNPSVQQHHETVFYKKQTSSGNQAIKVQLTGPLGDMNDILIVFADGLSTGLDIGYDAGKLKGNQNLALSMRLVQDNGFDYAIQGLPELVDSVMLVLGFDASVTGEYSISLNTSAEDMQVVLEDKLTGTLTAISQSAYHFSLNETGQFPDRFLLHIKGSPTAINEVGLDKDFLTMYANGKLIIKNQRNTFQNREINIFTMNGNLVFNKTITLAAFAEEHLAINLSSAMYIVQIQGKEYQHNQKIIVTN